ncbi:MAG: threonine ammonia-lyase [Thermoplasmata archaeon]
MVTLGQIREAARGLAGQIFPTPLIRAPRFPGLESVELYLKLENLQWTGSFKLRGAMNCLAHLPPDTLRRGVVAASAGNHAQGVAYAGRAKGVPVTIVMARSASPLKVAATRSLGATVILEGSNYDEAKQYALALAHLEDRAFIPAFDDPHVIAGQGTVGLEILEALPTTAAIVAGVGGGGLLAGIAAAARGLGGPTVRIIGVQPTGVDSFRPALDAGHVVTVAPPRTFADGLATREVGRLPLEILRAARAEAWTVEDSEIARASFLLLEQAKILAEGAGSAPLAGLLAHADVLPNGPIVAVISGGNLDPFVLDRVLWYGLVAEGRLLRLRTLLGDRPGQLNGFLQVAADQGANVRQIHHEREAPGGGPTDVRVEIELEVEGPEHAARLTESYRRSGWNIEPIPLAPDLRVDRSVTATPGLGT